MADEIVIAAPPARTDVADGEDPSAPALGRWYVVRQEAEDGYDAPDPWMGCVVHVGSNYVELQGVSKYASKARVHFDEFWDVCEHVPDPESVIDAKIRGHQDAVRMLMGRVKELTARLAITSGPALPSGNETSALALRSDQPMDEYKTALVEAKEKTLPELFEKIENENNALAQWMKAKLIPLKAQAEGLKTTIEAINDRIFSVELYAGLVETVEQVREGEPAALTEKIRLMQRRCYMDEECLARYEAGGMEFKNLASFDRWLSRKKNMDRILPFPRCVVAFQVRRNRKDRDAWDIGSFIRMIEDEKLDRLTFLYIRNGEQLFRLNTGIEFDYHLFPDMTQDQLAGKMYAKIRHGGDVKNVISEGQYQAMVADEEERIQRAKRAPKKDRWKYEVHSRDSKDYHPFSPDSVYYDDIAAHVQAEMARHNRLVLVIQGLLDRSPVLHPHPPWQIWSQDGFKAALELVYDDSRTLAAGEKPDFEKYRARLNESLKPGCVTIGQEDLWELREGERESARRDRSPRYGNRDYRPERYRPHGNPGPGKLAVLQWFQKKINACTYKWNRKKASAAWDSEEQVQDTITVDASKVMNVDAYQPGDFHIFFDDPRTRQEYLQWAKFLLEAEEYKAGNREVTPPPPPPPPKPKSPIPSWRHQQYKRRKALVGKAVRLTRRIETRSKKAFEKGSLWRVTALEAGGMNIAGILKDGRCEEDAEGCTARFIRLIELSDVELAPDVPDPPKGED